MIGVVSEYCYITFKHGVRDTDWSIVGQALLGKEDKKYDRLTIELSDETRKIFFFDITDFFGKNEVREDIFDLL